MKMDATTRSQVLVFSLVELSLLGALTLSKASMNCNRERAKHNTAQTVSNNVTWKRQQDRGKKKKNFSLGRKIDLVGVTQQVVRMELGATVPNKFTSVNLAPVSQLGLRISQD